MPNKIAVITEETPFHPLDYNWPDQPGDRGWITLNNIRYPIVESLTAATAFSPSVGAPGTVDITVTATGGTSSITPNDRFTYFLAFGRQINIRSMFQTDTINEILWSSIPFAAFYSVYDSENNLLFSGNQLSFFDHDKKQLTKIHGSSQRIVYTYFVTWTDSLGVQSSPYRVTIP